MTDADRQERNAILLAQCWPPFGSKVGVIVSIMEQEGRRPRVQQAWRSPAEQAEDVRREVSTVLFGFHNVTAAGGKPESLAVDLVDDDHPLAAPWDFIRRVNELVTKAGLMTGILWNRKGDRFPLTEVEKARILNATHTGDWSLVKPQRVGFDALHIQPVGLKPREAQAGKRPA